MSLECMLKSIITEQEDMEIINSDNLGHYPIFCKGTLFLLVKGLIQLIKLMIGYGL